MATYQEIFEAGYKDAFDCGAYFEDDPARGEHRSALKFSLADVAEVLWAFYDSPYGGGTFEDRGTDDGSVALVRLKDGRFGVFEESEDYSGHG